MSKKGEFKNMKRNKILLLSFLGFFLLILLSFSPIMNSDFNFNSENFKNSKVSGKIHLIGNSGWSNAKTTGICTGSGTSNDPYIIEDLVIDGGGAGSCIWIDASIVYFRIENCTLSNAGEDWGDGGIKLFNVNNGQIINNTANNNDFIGIILEFCHYNNISGNIANGNLEYGIGLWESDHNVISENLFKYNGWGLSFETCNNNDITGNNANDNDNDGIGIWNSNNNFISENNISDNSRGLFLYNSE